MKTKIHRYILVLLVFLPFTMNANADSLTVRYDSTEIIPLKFNTGHINKYKSDKAFDYNEYKYQSKFWTKVKRWIYNVLYAIFKWLFGQKKAVGYLSKFIKIIPYLGLAALIFIIIRFLFVSNFIRYFRDNDAEAKVSYGEDEEIIRKKDIDTLLKDAIEKENFRLALRYYYLMLLKKLEKNNIIKWEPQKTNFEYLKEIKHKEFKDKFKLFTKWYDYIWYGKYPLNSFEFSTISGQFDSFFKNLNK